MVANLAGGESLSAVAESKELTAQDGPNVPRGVPVPDPAATEAYFEVPVPAEGKVSPGKATLGDGRVLVFAVTKVTPGDPKEASEQERAALQQQLAQVAGSEDADGMLKALRKRLKITVADSSSEEHKSQLQSLMRISYDVFCL